MADDPVVVLAVDDLPQNLRLLDAVLSPRGYRVITAASGEEALAILDEHDVDLVLLDIMMPGIMMSSSTRSTSCSSRIASASSPEAAVMTR